MKGSLKKSVYILIGQKGSGKTFAGQIIQDRYGIKFVRVEDIARGIKKGRTVTDESYHIEVFSHIESYLRKVLKEEPAVVFESTGLGSIFDRMRQTLSKDFKVVTIAVKADSELCLERIKTRDQSIHINVSDEDIKYINLLVRQRNFKCDFELNNNGSREELVSLLDDIF